MGCAVGKHVAGKGERAAEQFEADIARDANLGRLGHGIEDRDVAELDDLEELDRAFEADQVLRGFDRGCCFRPFGKRCRQGELCTLYCVDLEDAAKQPLIIGAASKVHSQPEAGGVNHWLGRAGYRGRDRRVRERGAKRRGRCGGASYVGEKTGRLDVQILDFCVDQAIPIRQLKLALGDEVQLPAKDLGKTERRVNANLHASPDLCGTFEAAIPRRQRVVCREGVATKAPVGSHLAVS